MNLTVFLKGVVAAVLLPVLTTASAQTVRLANGAAVQGEPIKATPEGLEVNTPRGAQVFPWETLSPATRYRHQPGFREKFSSVLAGEAVAIEAPKAEPWATDTGSKTGTPQKASTFTPVVAQAPAAQPDKKPETGTSPRSQTPAASSTVMPFPAGTFVNDRNAAVFGLMFGPEPKDTLYMGFDLPAERGKRPDKLFVRTSNPPEGTPVQVVPAVIRNAGVFFDGIKWSGTREEYDLEAAIEIQYRGGHTHQLAAVVRLDGRKGNARVRYFLRCPELSWASAPKAPPVIKIFETPAITARFTEGGRKMIAMVKAGVWDLLPLQGAVDQQLQFEVLDGRGRSTERGRVKTDESVLRGKSEAWENEFKKMKGGETYQIKLSMNLGELFGNATFEQLVTAVDLK